MNRKILDLVLVCALLIAGCILLSIGVTKPLNGHHDFNNRFFQSVANSYLDKGYLALRFGQYVGVTESGMQQFYTHHPVMLPIVLSVSILGLGSNPTAVRIVPIIFSLATLFVFYFLVRKFINLWIVLFSCFFWLANPMFLYFGKMANHEALTLFFIVLSLYFYCVFFQTKQKKYLTFSLITILAGQWAGWPAYYLAGILFVISRDKRYIVFSVLNFTLFIGHVLILTGSLTGGGLVEIFAYRLGVGQLPGIQEVYTPVQFVAQEVSWLYHFFTGPLIWINFLGAALITLQFLRRKLNFGLREQIWLGFLGVAVLHVVIFRHGAWRHDYWLYYFLPALVFGVAQTYILLKEIAPKVNDRAVVLLFAGLVVLSWTSSQPFFWALQNMLVPE